MYVCKCIFFTLFLYCKVILFIFVICICKQENFICIINLVHSTFLFHLFCLFFLIFSCPVGQRRLGATQCINEDECQNPNLCQNGGRCVDLDDSRHYRCECAYAWRGRHCEEPAPPAVLVLANQDFIILFIFCLIGLCISKFFFHSFLMYSIFLHCFFKV